MKRQPFEAAMLPDQEKEILCRQLLAEFGVTSVKSSGNGELIHSCPLPFGLHHNGDKNPSASLNFKKLTFCCLGCGNSGGLLWFIATCRQTSSEDAKTWLRDHSSMGGEDLGSLLAYFEAVYAPERQQVAPIPKMDRRILDPWLKIHPYLTEIRGVPEENIIKLLVGYGVFKMETIGANSQWIESERIVLPHIFDGTLVGWQTRRIFSDKTSKYINSPDFPKDTTLFNYDRSQSSAVIVESPMSVVSKLHVDHMEATFGAKVTDRQIQRLANHQRVVLFFDADEAGWQATNRVGESLERYSDVLVAPNSWAADPGDMDDETFASLVDEAVPFALWSPPAEVYEWKGAA